jgi:hypothetical protein
LQAIEAKLEAIAVKNNLLTKIAEMVGGLSKAAVKSTVPACLGVISN